MRKLATIEKILDIQPIEKADAISRKRKHQIFLIIALIKQIYDSRSI